MCQTTIYHERNGKKQEILRDVISMERSGDSWVVKVLLEEPTQLRGRIVKIDFLKYTVTIVLDEA